MAIIVDKDGNVVVYENQPDTPRGMFPNLQEGKVSDIQINGRSIVDADGVVNFAPWQSPALPRQLLRRPGTAISAGNAQHLL